jgi:hypothetical protein
MKARLFVPVAVIALLAFAVAVGHSDVWAGQEKPAGPVEDSKAVIPVEFSNLPDKDDAGGGGLGAADPEQVLFTDPPDAVGPPLPRNTFDFGGDGQVDALANGQDAYFGELLVNRANLLVSFLGDPLWGGLGNPMAVYLESIGGPKVPNWQQVHLNNPGALDDLDGLEVWGPLDADDANYYSLKGDLLSGVSVFHANSMTPAYVPWAVIVAAVTNVALGADVYVGPVDSLDLDGLMVKDMNDTTSEFGDGDTIIFSVRNTQPLGNWDGGEIVVLPFGGAPFILFHGGHLWNTAFDIQTAFNVDTEEVDGIEAYPAQPRSTPALSEWGLIILIALLIGSATYVMLRRRKAAVPA